MLRLIVAAFSTTFLSLAALAEPCASRNSSFSPRQDPTVRDAGVEEAPVLERARIVGELIDADPQWEADLFAQAFLQQVPAPRMRAIFIDVHRRGGKLEALTVIEQMSPYAGRFDLLLSKGFEVVLTVGVETEAPYRIHTLLLGPPTPVADDFDAVFERLAALPGKTSLCAARLGAAGATGGIEVLAQHAPEERLGVGSTFKLFILGALVRAANEGQHEWDEVIRLREDAMSLPSGILQGWPVGAPVTLHTLASLMISQSDNTATDHLLFLLGREQVEAMLPRMGVAADDRNVPFLATSEMFKLKGIDRGAHAAKFAPMRGKERRAYLSDTLAGAALEDVEGIILAAPTYIDSIEWFFTTEELCRAMDWLRRSFETEGGEPARGVLGINPGLDVPRDAFDYVGYKGGSEGGVLNLTFLLRAKRGQWYALSASWNDTEEPLDEATFLGLTTQALRLLGKQVSGGGEH